MAQQPQVIVVGGGLAGLSAAHTVLEHGHRVLVLDKNPFFGGNSTKATSGINGTPTGTQKAQGIPDSAESFYDDTARSARDLIRPELVKVLTYKSGSAVEWLQNKFNLDLSLVSRLGGHSHPRTHRGKEKFPGMTITYALMEKLEDVCEKQPERARTVYKANVVRVLKEGEVVVGVEYDKGGKLCKEYGPVVLATGGYAADFTNTSLLQKYRPDLVHLPTTNGPHSTGDGHKMAISIGANSVDMEKVQVHPTGLVDPKDPDAKVKFLAAEALRGVGGILLTSEGKRFADELGHRDYVTGEMWKNKGPFRLVLNSKASQEIEWHCKHYMGRGLMKRFGSGAEVAKEIGCDPKVLDKTFKDYNMAAKNKSCPFGKKFFHNVPFEMNDNTFYVAIVTPVLHFTMGGLEITPDSEVLAAGQKIPGLFASGEIAGGVHGANRLGGSSLLGCVVYGRVSGDTASQYLATMKPREAPAQNMTFSGQYPLQATITQGSGVTRVAVDPANQLLHLDVSWANATAPAAHVPGEAPPQPVAGEPAPEQSAAAPAPQKKEFTMEEVAKHNTENDCWIVVNGQVLDVTKFQEDHPGGARALQLYAGKDATEEFNMLHKPDVIEKYADYTMIGTLAGSGAPAASDEKQEGQSAPRGGSNPSPPQEPLNVQPGKVQSLTCGGTEGILDEERDKATFDVEKFINAADGGADITKRRRFIMSPSKMVVREKGHHEWDRHKMLKEHIKAFIKVHEAYWDTFQPKGMDIAWMSEYSFAGGSLMNHMGLFLSTLEMHASAEQKQWWMAKSRRMGMIGCYAQTELGHGSNVRGLQTIAEFDKSKQQFVLNTPTLQSIKWWPGTLGKVATHAAVYAQLIINGKEYGVHSFMVQIRDHNHHPLPGIRLGDLGAKMGDHANDTGYMIMENVRIPREYMLANYQYVTPEGEYVVTKEKEMNPRIIYSTMIMTRGMMVRSAGGKLARAVTVATRYSAVRQQGFVSSKDKSFRSKENKIIDYQIQQYRIFKQMSLAYAIRFTGAWMLNKMDALKGDSGFSQIDDLPEIAAISSGLKSLATFMASQGIEDCRKCCGGNGYLLEAGLAPLVCDYLWQTTAEGDWIILMLQTARYLLKRLQDAMAGKPSTEMVPYLDNLGKEPPMKATSEAEILNISYLLELYKFGCQKTLIQVGQLFQEKLAAASGDMTKAINSLAVDMMNLVRFHTMFTFLNQFAMVLPKVTDGPCRKAMEDLCLMFGLSQMIDDANWIGLIPSSTIGLAKRAVVTVMSRLRPNAVALADAFDFPDRCLDSVIGTYDGNVYEALFEAAQRSELNQVDPFEGYEEVLQPYLDRDMLAKGNVVPAKVMKL